MMTAIYFVVGSCLWFAFLAWVFVRMERRDQRHQYERLGIVKSHQEARPSRHEEF